MSAVAKLRRGSAPTDMKIDLGVAKEESRKAHIDLANSLGCVTEEEEMEFTKDGTERKTKYLSTKDLEDVLRSSALSNMSVMHELGAAARERERFTHTLEVSSSLMEARKQLWQLASMASASEGGKEAMADARSQEKIRYLERKLTKLEGDLVRAGKFENEVRSVKRDLRRAESKRIQVEHDWEKKCFELEETIHALEEEKATIESQLRLAGQAQQSGSEKESEKGEGGQASLEGASIEQVFDLIYSSFRTLGKARGGEEEEEREGEGEGEA
mmetsp:Transcript_5892/g.14012  ORF Transcript_5892/g.14012 Transcript_5892/m.14012 type:complete len:272 (-) Transcript_5892:116-931(-)